jgi:hypothetical protein
MLCLEHKKAFFSGNYFATALALSFFSTDDTKCGATWRMDAVQVDCGLNVVNVSDMQVFSVQMAD